MSSGKFSCICIMRNSLTVTPQAVHFSLSERHLVFRATLWTTSTTSLHRTLKKRDSNLKFKYARAIGSPHAEKSHWNHYNGSFPGMWSNHAYMQISPVMTYLWHLPLKYVKALNRVQQVHLKVTSQYSAHTSSPRLSWMLNPEFPLAHKSTAVVSQQRLKRQHLNEQNCIVNRRSHIIKNYNIKCKVDLTYSPKIGNSA